MSKETGWSVIRTWVLCLILFTLLGIGITLRHVSDTLDKISVNLISPK